jgi:cytochrome c2
MYQKMGKQVRIALAMLVVGAFVFVSTVSAGGWAMVTLDTLPVEPHAGESLNLGFMVRQHGLRPANFAWESEPITPYLFAENLESGQSIRIAARQEGSVGHFVVDVVFPSAGTWKWHIVPEPFGAFPEEFEPLTVLPASSSSVQSTPENQAAGLLNFWWLVVPGLILIVGVAVAVQRRVLSKQIGLTAGAVGLTALLVVLFVGPAVISNAATAQPTEVDSMAAASPPDAGYGRALFIAKGCAACHIHNRVGRSVPGPLWGPNLSHVELDPEFIRQWLRNPAAIEPDTDMPTLTLSETEIEALVLFLTTGG